MLQPSDKKKTFQVLKEDEFRSEVIIPLLKNMGMQQVRERHGTQEYGKDITFFQVSPLGNIYSAVVAKVGKIDGSAGGKSNLDTVLNQVKMAFNMPLEDIEQKQKYSINEVIVWTSGNIANNAERRIMESIKEYRNIRFFDGQKTLELLEQYYPSFFTIRDPYISEYYSAAKEAFARLEELRALGGSVEHHRLETMFVPPILTRFQGKRNQKSVRSSRNITNEYSIEDIIESHDDIAILGDAGAGKSTLLRHVLLSIINTNEQEAKKTPIPIFISMKKIKVTDEYGIEQAATSEFFRFTPKYEVDENRLNFNDGSILLLLDSVDELKSEELMFEALEQIRLFKERHKETRIILTSRFIDGLNKIAAFSGFQIFEIRALTRNQMVKFIHNWYGKENQITAKMTQFLQNPLALQGLPSTPLTLALVAILYENGNKEIPANLTELFQKYVELALGRWDLGKDVSIQFEWKIKEFILQKIGWHMHEVATLSLNERTFLQLIKDIDMQRSLGINIQDFCREIIARSELLIINEDGEYEFKHRSFKDYFAGIELNERPNALDLVIEHAIDGWWSQTIFFASGMRPSNHIYIQAILEKVQLSRFEHILGAFTVGRLLQGAYLVQRDIKEQAVRFVIQELINAWNPFCEVVNTVKEDPTFSKVQLSHIDLVYVFGIIGQTSLGSVTLIPILQHLVEEFEQLSVSAIEEAGSKGEWYRFLLALANLRSGNISGFVSLFPPSVITASEPSFIMVIHNEAKGFLKNDWLIDHDKKALEVIIERLENRLHGLKQYRYNAFHASPQPLLDQDTTKKTDAS